MVEVLPWLGSAVAVAALILNALYIRIAWRQIQRGDLESERLRTEIEKLKIERDYLRAKYSGSSMITP